MKRSLIVFALVSALGATGVQAQAMDFGEAAGTFIGGVVGGAIGNRAGHGNPWGTLAGSAVGGIIGRELMSQPKSPGGYDQIPAPPVISEQPVYQQPPQVIYQQPPQVVYQAPQVVYQPPPVVVYQQPRVIYAPGYYYHGPGTWYRNQIGRW